MGTVNAILVLFLYVAYLTAAAYRCHQLAYEHRHPFRSAMLLGVPPAAVLGGILAATATTAGGLAITPVGVVAVVAFVGVVSAILGIVIFVLSTFFDPPDALHF